MPGTAPARAWQAALKPNTEPRLSLVNSLSRAALRVAATPLRAASATTAGVVAAERRARTTLRDTGERLALDTLDAIVSRLMNSEAIDRLVEHADTARLAQRLADRILQDGVAEQIAQRAIAGPELEQVIATTLESRLPEAVVSYLLQTEALWVLVDEIARSPSVTEAIAHQGSGFVEQVAGVARARSRAGDAWAERVAHRVIGRRRARAVGDGRELPGRASLPGGGMR